MPYTYVLCCTDGQQQSQRVSPSLVPPSLSRSLALWPWWIASPLLNPSATGTTTVAPVATATVTPCDGTGAEGSTACANTSCLAGWGAGGAHGLLTTVALDLLYAVPTVVGVVMVRATRCGARWQDSVGSRHSNGSGRYCGQVLPRTEYVR